MSSLWRRLAGEDKTAPDKKVNPLGSILDRKLVLKTYIRNVANKAERVIRVVGALGGTIPRVRGSALRPQCTWGTPGRSWGTDMKFVSPVMWT